MAGGQSVRARRTLVVGGVGIVLVVLVAALVVATAGPVTAKQFATLHLLVGRTDVRSVDEDAFHRGMEGEALRQGDTVRTAPGGRAEIEYFDGSLTRLDFNTTFTLEELASTPDRPDSKQITGSQESGNTFSRIVELTDSTSRFEVETPTAVASVRGTWFFSLLNFDGSTLFGVIRGAVVIRGQDGTEVAVPAGKGLTVAEGGALGAPFTLTSAQLGLDFLQFNLCQIEHVVGDVCTQVESLVVKPKKKEPEPEPVPEPEPEPLAITVPVSQPVEEEKSKKNEPPPPPPPPPEPGPIQVEEPPQPPPPPPPSGPPCLNPGSTVPCDPPGLGSPGNPPGHGGAPPGQLNGNGGGKA